MKGLTLVTGSEGLVGSRFVELYPQKNFLHGPTEVEMDITDPEVVKDVFERLDFSAVVNFAAFTDVGGAEDQRGDKDGVCWRVNVEGVKNLLSFIDPNKTHFIHISTDMVFPGTKDDPGPYGENHLPGTQEEKHTWYGYSKAMAERYILDKYPKNTTILRLIYPVRARFDEKLDYLRKPLSLFDENKLYPLFNDQQISITYIDEACDLIDKIITEKKYGIFHASTSDTTTPHEIISYMIKKLRGSDSQIKAKSIDEFLTTVDTKTRYPKFGGLSSRNTTKELDYKLSSWKEVVDKLIKQGLGG